MYPYIHFFRTIPTYGIFMVTGALVANVIAIIKLRRVGLSGDDFMVVEGYGLLGAIIGSKMLYLLINVSEIDYSRLGDPKYLASWMQGGFVFYGGLIGGLLSLPICKKIHHIPIEKYIQHIVFLIPFAHSFGRIGCFMAGCCYGRPYDGFGAVVFPEDSFAPAGIKLFPVQLLEALFLLLISVILFVYGRRSGWKGNALFLYFMLYGIIRFVTECFRYDIDERGGLFGGLSLSQWLSIMMLIIGTIGWFLQGRLTKQKFGR